MRSIFYLSFLALMACSPVYLDDLRDQSPLSPTPFAAQLRAEPYFMRIDLLRQTTTTTDANGNTSTEKVDYSPLGLYLGEGLFIDAHKNVSLLVEELYDKSTQDVLISYKPFRSWPNTKINYQRVGEYFYKQNNSFLSGKDEVWKYNTSVHFERPNSQRRIQISQDALIYHQLLNKEEMKQNSQGFHYKGFLDRDDITSSPDLLTWDRLSISRQKDGWTISNGWSENLQVNFDGRTWYVYDRNYRGYRIWREGRKINVEENGQRCGTWTLE